MKKAVWVLTPVLAVLAILLLVLLTVVAIATPAVSEQIAQTQCANPLPATGDWRPPFQQAYTTYTGATAFTTDHPSQTLISQPGPGPVVAAAAGTVTAAGTSGTAGEGTVVQVAHPGGISTRYAHLATLDPAVTAGATISLGQTLGQEGATGVATNQLEFTVLEGGTRIDPVPFMREHGAPLDGIAVAPTSNATGTAATAGPADPDGQGGVGFTLPAAGTPRQDSLHNPALPIPAPIQTLYRGAATRYGLPWTLLAGIGMEETGHGRNTAVSSAGAQGVMQFMPATFNAYAVDGDGDGRTVISSDADSIYTAANYLTKSGVTNGPQGVRDAVYAYNHADWYVNDVLHYAGVYGGGTVQGDPSGCGPGTGNGKPNLPPITDDRITTVLTWAASHVGNTYVMGANGPTAWDCSSYSRAAYSQIGISMPRTAEAQRDWLAAGNGQLIPVGQEKPGDLIFWDSYLGPNIIGHVLLVWDSASQRTIEAHGSSTGVGYFSYASGPNHHIFQIWRVGNVSPTT